MGQALRLRISKHINEKYDVKSLKGNAHYFILLGVSVVVFMDMEKRLAEFKTQTSSSMSEREYEQQQTYKQIMEQLGEYDGVGTPLENLESTLPTYKYENQESED